MITDNSNYEIDQLTGLPIISGVYSLIDRELSEKEEVGFLHFEINDFRTLEEKYGYEKCQKLLSLVGDMLLRQKGLLYRDEDLVTVGGKGIAYFILFLFSPPRRKSCFTSHDLKLISTRIKQKLQHVIDEHSDELELENDVDFHTGYTVIKKDPYMDVERLIYEARKEAGFKAQLEDIMIQFISNVSHELRTPLTSIKGYAETLLAGAMEDHNLCSRWLQIIYDESGRLERLINDLLDLSMLEAEQVELMFKQTSLPELTEKVISVLHQVAAKEEVEIISSFEEDFPNVFVDEDRIKQVLLNLIHNAVKYSPRGSKVCVSGRKLKREVEITISDEGCGIPEKHKERIFERFYRADKNRVGKTAGRGLGLAIARHIVESHGGTIGVRDAQGSGSLFYFTIPLDTVLPVDEEAI